MKVLLSQRHLDEMLGGLWEFPGGKTKPNESLEDCLRREIKEELGIDIEVREHIGAVKHEISSYALPRADRKLLEVLERKKRLKQ